MSFVDIYNNGASDNFRNKSGSVGRNRTRNINTLAPVYYVASWKGLEFFCDSSTDEFGRRGDVYEYPLSNDVGYKDMGRRARRFKVEGYLIGSEQVGISQQMANAAEDPEPDILSHPLFGDQRVACVTLAITADYRKDKKRTKLAFEFVEANDSLAPFAAGKSIQEIYDAADNAAQLSQFGMTGQWNPNTADIGAANDMSSFLGYMVSPAIDENSFDAVGMLNRGTQFEQRFGTWDTGTGGGGIVAVGLMSRAPAPRAVTSPQAAEINRTFNQIVWPIDYGTATIRRIHEDALTRLRDFNAYVVNIATQNRTASVQALVVTTRLLTIRDYATAAGMKAYDTVKAALDDLDFIMNVYDDEEEIAARRCDDVLVDAIRKARATAAATILARNIRLPGITEFPVDGHWPSVVAAHKLYADGRRYKQIEDYNPTMPPFWMGRAVVAPTR